jgi:uncharacterized protein (DUF58 family)
MAATVADLRSRALAYAERRLPALTRLRRAEKLPITLDRRRIYVLPTGFGVLFAVLLFVMLIGALNYSNNPALLLTCLLGAACGASLFIGFRAMNGLGFARADADTAHVGGALVVRFHFAPTSRTRPSLRLRSGTTEVAFALDAGSDNLVALSLVPESRGWFRPGRLRLSTDYPLGIFRIWSWLNPDVEFLVYPAIESPAPSLPSSGGRDAIAHRSGGGEDPSGLRDYRITDPPRLIAWKPSARHDALLVRDIERRGDDAVVLDYAALRALDTEARIRRLAAWVLAADASQRDYALMLPHETIGPGAGAAHRHACLRALALMPA